jgi:hypothetical protein
MNDEETIQAIEVDIKEATAAVEYAKALDKLERYHPFKKIILEGYFKEEAIKLVGTKSANGYEDEASQKAIIKAIDGIGELAKYLQTIKTLGRMNEKAIQENKNRF